MFQPGTISNIGKSIRWIISSSDKTDVENFVGSLGVSNVLQINHQALLLSMRALCYDVKSLFESVNKVRGTRRSRTLSKSTLAQFRFQPRELISRPCGSYSSRSAARKHFRSCHLRGRCSLAEKCGHSLWKKMRQPKNECAVW